MYCLRSAFKTGVETIDERKTVMRDKAMLKTSVRAIDKKGLHYVIKNGNEIKRFKPWIADSFSFLYDFIMRNSIFPRKFGGNISRHYEILGRALKDIQGERVLELATGSGSAINFLNRDNRYTGTDISPGLLRKAMKNFVSAGFEGAEFYVTSADDLPFNDNTYSVCLCILSMNFFNDAKKVFEEIKRVLVPGGVFFCSVPVPERNRLQSTIRGVLYSEDEFAEICKEHDFTFLSIPSENGALVYFKAILEK